MQTKNQHKDYEMQDGWHGPEHQNENTLSQITKNIFKIIAPGHLSLGVSDSNLTPELLSLGASDSNLTPELLSLGIEKLKSDP